MELFSAYILHVTLASVAAVYCLLGYWLAFGSQSWMWRAGTVCAALALLVPIRAYEPLVFFAFTSLFFVAAAGRRRLLLSWLQKRRTGISETNSTDVTSPQPRFQFRLHDLLGLTAIIGVAAWMTRIILREQVLLPWVGTLLSAAVAVAITLATIGLLRGPRRVVSGVLLLLVVGVSADYFHWLHRGGPLGPPVQYIIGADLGEQLFWSSLNPGGRLLILLLTFLMLLTVSFGAARAIQPKEANPLRRRLWQVLGVVPCVVWLLPATWLYWQLLSYPQPPAQIRNRPNVLPLLLERGQALESLSGAQARVVSAEVIELSKQPGFIQVPWETDLRGRKNYDENLFDEIQTARNISRGLDAHATALEKADPDLAVEPLMACLRIGNMLEHEGLMIHGLVGYAVDGTGESHLIHLRQRISLAKVREIIAQFEALEKSRDDGDVARDKLWYSLNDRWAFRLDQVLKSGAEHGGNSSYYYHGLANKRSRCITRLLMVDLALRAYHADNGEYPPKLESLAPRYLTEVPLDPFCEKPFVYRPAAQDFVFYSMGGDGVDNGGTFGPQQYIVSQWEGYDLNLDAPHE